MKIRIANVDVHHKDLIVQSSGGLQNHRAIPALSFGQRLAREFTEIELGDNEILILRPRGAKDPDGIDIKTPV